MLRFIIFTAIFAWITQALPKESIENNPVPGYKRASLLESKADIIEVAPLSLELQQRYQLEHADELLYIEPLSSGKPSKVLKMNLPKQEEKDTKRSNKMRVVVGMDKKGEMRMMQIPRYYRDDTWEEE